ncbi:MAG TPA: hypothetical protein VK970_03155 [Candidatus Methylacidiphilales bacterium]|nr:hypothetical protein [Candidatus Methylacidiphilales bacterium]
MADSPATPPVTRLLAHDDDAPSPVQAPWYRRWEIMVPLAFVIVLLAPVGAWYGVGALAEWSFDRFLARLNSQGYTTDRNPYYLQQSREWLAARDADPLLSHAPVRLALYGARIASLNPTTRNLERLPGYESARYSLTSVELASPISIDTIDELSQQLLDQMEARTAMMETVHQPDEGEEDTLADVDRLLLQEDVPGTGLVLALWPARLPGVHGLYRAARWRYILGIDAEFPLEPDNLQQQFESKSGFARAIDSMYLAHSYVYYLRGQPYKIITLWQDLYRRPAHYRSLTVNVALLSYCIRSGLFRLEQLQQLWDGPFPNADDLRDQESARLRAFLATLARYKSTCEGYGHPNMDGLQLLTDSKYKPQRDDPTLLDLLPKKTRLMAVRARALQRLDYLERLEAGRGTTQWPDFRDTRQDLMSGKYLGNIALREVSPIAGDACVRYINLQHALLGFALYRARTGRLPERAEDFMTPEVKARIIQCPYMQLAYQVSPTGVIKIGWAYTAFHPYEARHFVPVEVVAYHPGDKPVRFPVRPDKGNPSNPSPSSTEPSP